MRWRAARPRPCRSATRSCTRRSSTRPRPAPLPTAHPRPSAGARGAPARRAPKLLAQPLRARPPPEPGRAARSSAAGVDASRRSSNLSDAPHAPGPGGRYDFARAAGSGLGGVPPARCLLLHGSDPAVTPTSLVASLLAHRRPPSTAPPVGGAGPPGLDDLLSGLVVLLPRPGADPRARGTGGADAAAAADDDAAGALEAALAETHALRRYLSCALFVPRAWLSASDAAAAGGAVAGGAEAGAAPGALGALPCACPLPPAPPFSGLGRIHEGYFPRGSDEAFNGETAVEMSLAEAVEYCHASVGCRGFTYQGDAALFGGKARVWFKTSGDVAVRPKSGWCARAGRKRASRWAGQARGAAAERGCSAVRRGGGRCGGRAARARHRPAARAPCLPCTPLRPPPTSPPVPRPAPAWPRVALLQVCLCQRLPCRRARRRTRHSRPHHRLRLRLRRGERLARRARAPRRQRAARGPPQPAACHRRRPAAVSRFHLRRRRRLAAALVRAGRARGRERSGRGPDLGLLHRLLRDRAARPLVRVRARLPQPWRRAHAASGAAANAHCGTAALSTSPQPPLPQTAHSTALHCSSHHPRSQSHPTTSSPFPFPPSSLPCLKPAARPAPLPAYSRPPPPASVRLRFPPFSALVKVRGLLPAAQGRQVREPSAPLQRARGQAAGLRGDLCHGRRCGHRHRRYAAWDRLGWAWDGMGWDGDSALQARFRSVGWDGRRH